MSNETKIIAPVVKPKPPAQTILIGGFQAAGPAGLGSVEQAIVFGQFNSVPPAATFVSLEGHLTISPVGAAGICKVRLRQDDGSTPPSGRVVAYATTSVPTNQDTTISVVGYDQSPTTQGYVLTIEFPPANAVAKNFGFHATAFVSYPYDAFTSANMFE
jgi:hypothetical protein